MRYKIIIILSLLIISGCGSFDKKPAEELMKKVYACCKVGDFNQALSFYSDDFYSNTSRKEWRNMLVNIQKKLGKLEDFELSSWFVENVVGTGKSGTFYKLVFKVCYAKEYATETILLYRKKKGNPIKIDGHHIQSNGFLKK